jgi:hypothetical protein
LLKSQRLIIACRDYEPGGQEFESLQARHVCYKQGLTVFCKPFLWCAQHGRTLAGVNPAVCAVTECFLTWGDLVLCLKGRLQQTGAIGLFLIFQELSGKLPFSGVNGGIFESIR